MSMFRVIIFIWVLLSPSRSLVLASASFCSTCVFPKGDQKFEQKSDRFWEFNQETNSWVEIELPYDLVSCVNDNCTVVGSIESKRNGNENLRKEDGAPEQKESFSDDRNENFGVFLPLRKRFSLTRISDTSIWVTGVSGSIYERSWNEIQWVIAPHDLPISAGPAISVFAVNYAILALSEAGILYQMQLTEVSQPVWVEFIPTIDCGTGGVAEPHSMTLIKSSAISSDGMRVYFCTKNGLLLELSEIEPLRWVNHGQPPGADVAAIADAGYIRTEVIYVISSAGHLYEYDSSTKPSWKKHIWKNRPALEASLLPSTGCTLRDLAGPNSVSLFLLTRGGKLVERQLHHRKWKWLVHGSPKDHNLTSMTPAAQDELHENFLSLFFTTSMGSVLEYRLHKHSGFSQENQIEEKWVNHMHPANIKVARAISGIQYQAGRFIFPLHDGRLAELHLAGLGGENAGPNHRINTRKRPALKYIWTIIDVPESEGWNAEYCTEEQGPANCIRGLKEEQYDIGNSILVTRRRRGNQLQDHYLPAGIVGSSTRKTLTEYSFPKSWTNTNFRFRVMQEDRSFFLITEDGIIFEHICDENVWLWLKHEQLSAIKGAVGNYNGSLFLVDTYGSLLVRERSSNGLTWVNCTAMRKGRQVIGGPPWDRLPSKGMRVTAEDALFFVSKGGRLLQFTVAMRNFRWKDCAHPPATKIACIVDQEIFRDNIIFVIGRNGQLYQYNKVTELWHQHYQSQHLILSKSPGTAMKPSSRSLTGSLFMLSENGGLVEYHWNSVDGWNWVEHGTPCSDVTLVVAPGPCFAGNQLFVIGSDGKVYLRYKDQMTWKWKNFGFPNMEIIFEREQTHVEARDMQQEVCVDADFLSSLDKAAGNCNQKNRKCDSKVARTRPIPFSEDSIIFELRDGTLAEMRRVEDTHWVWSRIIGTPTSLCVASYWTELAS